MTSLDVPRIEATYLLPIRCATPASDELTAYLEWLARRVEVIVVDGSPPAVFEAHQRAWGGTCRHVAPDDRLRSANGKAWGVNTGLRLASHERVVIGDDDVRYDGPALERLCALLDVADVVRPQNYFAPAPWHARWDTSRTLLNRAAGGDWPGTLGVRRSLLPDGYDGDVLFENLELCRTVEAAGGRHLVALDLYVRRLPPTARHFWSQRVRQAYDEFARPRRMAAQLASLPLALMLVASGRRRFVLGAALASMAVAEAGRRRSGGRRYFSPVASLLAPVWIAERAVCAWLALGSRVRHGGVPYGGGVLARAATPARVLGERHARGAR